MQNFNEPSYFFNHALPNTSLIQNIALEPKPGITHRTSLTRTHKRTTIKNLSPQPFPPCSPHTLPKKKLQSIPTPPKSEKIRDLPSTSHNNNKQSPSAPHDSIIAPISFQRAAVLFGSVTAAIRCGCAFRISVRVFRGLRRSGEGLIVLACSDIWVN
jgi:hypothetical protein